MLKIKDNVCSYSVYKHTFPNSKIYVGITFRNPKIRWGNGNNYSNNKYMTNAIRKYGWNNISHEILFTGLTKEKQQEVIYGTSYKRQCGFERTRKFWI